MEEDTPSTIFEKIFEEFRAGNPLIFLTVLFVLVLLGVVWVWQTINTPGSFPLPRFTHPTAASRIKTLTAQAPHSSVTTPDAPVRASVLRPKADATPDAAFFPIKGRRNQNAKPSFAFLAGSPNLTRMFSR